MLSSTVVPGNGNTNRGQNHITMTNDHGHSYHPVIKSKDDTCTQTRVRHPTDRGFCPSAAPLSPTLLTNGHHFFENLTEARTRAYTAGARPMAPRMNVYKRADNQPIRPMEMNNEEKGSRGSNDQVDPVDEESPNKTIAKRESWLQKGWRAAQNHCQTIVKQTSPTTTPFPIDQQVDGKSTQNSGAAKSMSGFLERLRPRSNSDAASSIMMTDKDSMILASRKKNVKANGSNSAGESRKSSNDDYDGVGMGVLQKTESSPCNTHIYEGAGELDTWYEEEMFERFPLSPTLNRKRSNSEASNYLIMRKTSRPNGAEVLGALGNQENICKQLLTKFSCYELMPTQGAVVVIDCQLPTRQALSSLSENGVRAALLWDSKQRTSIRFLTVTDLLRIMYAYFVSPIPKSTTSTTKACQSGPNDRSLSNKASSGNQTVSEMAEILRQPIVSNLIKIGCIKSATGFKGSMLTCIAADQALHNAAVALRTNKIHRIAVVDPDTGNPLYLLSSKRLLHFLYNHMSNLPMPLAVYKSVDELRLGTWADTSTIISVTMKTTVTEAAAKFLEFGVSGLPVFDTCTMSTTSALDSERSGVELDANCNCKPNRLLDSITKVDLMHFILVSGWASLQEKTIADVLKARHPHMEKPITCHKKTPLSLAIDRMILLNAHRIYVVDSSGVLEGLFSVGDLLSYLLG